MRQELTLKDGTTIALLGTSALELSGNINVRNRFYAYVIDGDVATFVSLFSDIDNLEEMTFTGYDESGEIAYQHRLKYYNIVSSIGRDRIEKTDSETGETTFEYNLKAVLEQPTASERTEPSPDPETEEILNILLGEDSTEEEVTE